MLYRISVTERGLTGIANIFRSRLSRLDDLLGAGTVPLRITRDLRTNVLQINANFPVHKPTISTPPLTHAIVYWPILKAATYLTPTLRAERSTRFSSSGSAHSVRRASPQQ